MKKKKGKPAPRSKAKGSKEKTSPTPTAADEQEAASFGSVRTIKAGVSLSALLLAQKANGMTGPIY